MKTIVYMVDTCSKRMRKTVRLLERQFTSLILRNFWKRLCYRCHFHKIIFFTALLFLLSFSDTYAQQNSDYTLYANIIYRVTKYINWPDQKKTGDFIIGIIGDSPIYDEIKTFTASKTVGNQNIVIKTFSSSSASYDCQILFISEDASRSLKKIASVTERASILLISESAGLAQKGSCINLVIIDQHLKLEINKTNIEQRNLDVASEFLALGTIVK